jgi:pimeloyl-ACP methyl ester carboxylesterase
MSPAAQVFPSAPHARWRPGLLMFPALFLAACGDSGGPAMGIPGVMGGSPPGMMVTPTTPPPMGNPPGGGPGMPPTSPPPGTMGQPGMPPVMGPPGAFVEKPCAFTPAPTRPVRCGTVSVPEARDGTPTSRMVQLAVVIVKSDSPTPEPDPLVFLQGGPGGGGTDFTATLTGRMGGPLAAVLARRDVLSIDQRGTGRSLPLLDCPEAGVGGMKPPPMGMVMDTGAAALGRCRARLVGTGVDLNQYTTAAAADDVEDVRKALGYKQWNLLGGSYGTRLALEVVRRHPEGVRTLLLDSVAPPDVDLLGEAGPNSLRALEVVFSGCAAQAECARAYPELGKVFAQVIGGLNAMPASLLGGLLPLNGDTFLQVALLLIRSPATAAEMPEIVFQARDQRYTIVERVLLQLVMSMAGGGGAAGVAMGLHMSVMCADILPFTSQQAIDMKGAAISPELRGPLLRASLGYLENCKVWNVRPSPAAVTQAVTSPVPSLVLAGSLDPATPPAWAERASKTLSASHYFELKGVSHGVFPTPCGSALLAPFLDAPGQKPAPACLATLMDVAYRVQR